MNPSATQTLTLVQPYLFFNGHCEEALEFYQTAVGAKVTMLMRFREAPDPPPPGMAPVDWDEKIMHAELQIGATTLMASDGCETTPGFGGFSLALSLATEVECDAAFAALSDGGEVTMPLGKTFWSPRFGTLTDRFGLGWMINLASPGD